MDKLAEIKAILQKNGWHDDTCYVVPFDDVMKLLTQELESFKIASAEDVARKIEGYYAYLSQEEDQGAYSFYVDRIDHIQEILKKNECKCKDIRKKLDEFISELNKLQDDDTITAGNARGYILTLDRLLSPEKWKIPNESDEESK